MLEGRRFVIRLQLCLLLGLSVCGTPVIEPGIEAYENYLNEVDVEDENAEEKTRNAVQSPLQLWPENTIYFRIADDYTAAQAANVREALEFFNKATCLTFREYDPARDGDQAHIHYKSSPDMCGTNVGYNQQLSHAGHKVFLTEKCLGIRGVIQHETLHVLGLYHEQSRPDRNEHVAIQYDNIPAKYWPQFIAYPTVIATTHDVPYDFESLMHYSAYAFAKDPNKPTIYAKENHQLVERKMGQTNRPSEGDLKKIRIMYKC